MDDMIVYNLHKGEALAAEIEPSTPERRSWICVYPYKEPLVEFDSPAAPWRYRVRCIEIDRQLLAERNNDLDGDEQFIITREDVRLTTVEELEETLSRWMRGKGELTFTNRCDYPC